MVNETRKRAALFNFAAHVLWGSGRARQIPRFTYIISPICATAADKGGNRARGKDLHVPDMLQYDRWPREDTVKGILYHYLYYVGFVLYSCGSTTRKGRPAGTR